MGIISIEQTNRLYWLGRYTERTYTTLRLYMKSYDSMLDDLPGGYQEYCRRLERSRLSYDKTALDLIASFLKKEKPDYHQIVSETEKLLEV